MGNQANIAFVRKAPNVHTNRRPSSRLGFGGDSAEYLRMNDMLASEARVGDSAVENRKGIHVVTDVDVV